jgi:hypothetical protein
MSNVLKRYAPEATSVPDSRKRLKAQLYLICSDQNILKGVWEERWAAPKILTGHAGEPLGRVDVKCLRVGLGEDRRNIVMDMESAVFGSR